MQAEEYKQLVNDHTLLNRETASRLKELTLAYPWFQSAWYLYLKNLMIIGSPEFDETLKLAAVHVSSRSQLYHFVHAQLSEVGEKDSGSELVKQELKGISQVDLIDKFLENGPGRIKVKPAGEGEETKEENEIIQRSDAESDEIITETLAAIYFDQKNYKMALKAYKKLSLKYPEKSVYFATRIKEIEEIIEQ